MLKVINYTNSNLNQAMGSVDKGIRSFAYSSLSSIILAFLEAIAVYILTENTELFLWRKLLINSDLSPLLPTVMVLSWLLSSMIFSVYLPDRLNSIVKIFYYSSQAAILNAAIVMVLVGSKLQLNEGLYLLGGLLLAIYLVMLVFRIFLFTAYKVIRSLPSNRKPSIIVGYNQSAEQLYAFFKNTPHLYADFKGVFTDETIQFSELSSFHRGGMSDVKKFCLEHGIKEIYYVSSREGHYLNELLKFADYNFIYLGIVPELEIPENSKLETQIYDEGRIPVFSYRDTPLRRIFNKKVKRAFDVFFSLLVLLLLVPSLLPILAIIIKLDSPGPVFFKQLRPGLHNRLFWCYKFRTMCVNENECRQATKGDSRITRVGAFLRKTSMDELPQFYNVLLGDMSVVGPRPNMQTQLEYYSQHIEEYPLRHTITPGITGFAQISGYRGETKEMHLMRKRVEYDLIYMQNWSLKLDIKIIAMTIINIFKGEDNAY